MARRPRDYAAEYARRQALAKQRGFASYGTQRRAIEKGEIPAIEPTRLRKRSTIEAQEIGRGFIGVPSLKGEGLTSYEGIQAFRMEMALRWEETHSRSHYSEFDREKARNDPEYLNEYMAAWVMPSIYKDNTHDVDPSEYLHDYMIDNDLMDEEEWQQRYGEKE